MAHLIEDLLNLSRVSRSEIHRVHVDLSALARVVAAELQRTQPDRVVTFAIEGGVIHPRDGWAADYYGGKHTSAAVVRRGGVSNPGADSLRKKLAAL